MSNLRTIKPGLETVDELFMSQLVKDLDTEAVRILFQATNDKIQRLLAAEILRLRGEPLEVLEAA